jgi:hypothetical protein
MAVSRGPRREPIQTGMRTPEIECPICNADVPLTGDEKKGDEVFCTYCGAPLRLAGKGDEYDEAELEDDY